MIFNRNIILNVLCVLSASVTGELAAWNGAQWLPVKKAGGAEIDSSAKVVTLGSKSGDGWMSSDL
jgi:hypothetical protein